MAEETDREDTTTIANESGGTSHEEQQYETESVSSECPKLTNQEAKSKLREKYNKEYDKLHGSFKKENVKDYKDPEEVQSQIIDLSQLQDPPTDFKIPNLDARHPEMADGFALVIHHFWNINPQIFPRNAKDRIQLFRKLAYNQDDQYRPRDLRELSDLSRDAGPRLLKPEILRRLGKLPVSRHYPKFTEGTDWEEQRTRPIAFHQNLTSQNTGGDGGGDDPGPLAVEETPPNLNLIRECLERLLIQLRYRQLEVADPKKGEELFHALIDTSECSRRKRLPLKKMPLTLDNDHKVEKVFSGFTQPEYPFRERGPVGNEFELASNSRFDCIMMAGKFLDAGLTKIDVQNLHSHGEKETSAHRNFLNMVQNDWKKGGSTGSAEARQYFHRLLNDLEAKDFKDLLHKSTLLRPQFNHSISRKIRCAKDHEIDTPTTAVSSSLVSCDEKYIKGDCAGLTMQEVLQLLFPQEEPPQCGDQTGDVPCVVKLCEGKPNKIILRRSMPLRMAVSLSSQVSPVDHTSNDLRIKFYDDDEGGREHVAVYRWIGGIYADTKIDDLMAHYRLYWTDSLRGGKPSKTISMYDPLQADGQVIEGVFPASQNEPIPARWWQNKIKPVLFYERVFNPHLLDITLAAAILGDMKHASDNRQFILQVHDPHWNLLPAPESQSSLEDGSNITPPSESHSGTKSSREISGYVGEDFDTALDTLNSNNIHIQNGIYNAAPSYPSNPYSRDNTNMRSVGPGYNSSFGGHLVPPPMQHVSDYRGTFCAFNSDTAQLAPERPDILVTDYYSHPGTTIGAASNVTLQDYGQSIQTIPTQTSNAQYSGFSSRAAQDTSQFDSSRNAPINFDPNANHLSQTETSHNANEFRMPAPNSDDILQTSIGLSTLNSPMPASLEAYAGANPPIDNPDALFDVFDDIITEIQQEDLIGMLSGYPGDATTGGK